jgi:hypothetical protein
VLGSCCFIDNNNEGEKMFKPFENGDESSAIYDLTLENQVDCVSLYGNLQITKDQAGLKTAKALQSFINDVVAALEKQELPEQIERQPEQEIENPFL